MRAGDLLVFVVSGTSSVKWCEVATMYNGTKLGIMHLKLIINLTIIFLWFRSCVGCKISKMLMLKDIQRLLKIFYGSFFPANIDYEVDSVMSIESMQSSRHFNVQDTSSTSGN